MCYFVPRWQPANTLQRNHCKYFYNLTNAQGAPFLSQGTCHSCRPFLQALCNTAYSCSQLKRLSLTAARKSGTDMELLDTSSQEVTLWGSGRAAGHYSRGRSIFGTVSSPYQEACTLGTSALHNGREAEPHPDGTGMLEAFCSCRKKHSVVCSKKKKKWWLRWGILQKGTDGDLCAPYGTKTFTCREALFGWIVKCWFSVPCVWRLWWFVFPRK